MTVITRWNHAYIKHTGSFGNIYCTNLHHLSIHTLHVTTVSTDGMLRDKYKMIELQGYEKVIVCV